MNKSILLGRLTKEPDMFLSNNTSVVARFTIAVPRKYVKEGEERKTDFINIVAFGGQANFVQKYFKKGMQVLVSGRLEINQYEDENGETKYSTQVVAEELDFADSKKDDNTNIANEVVEGMDDLPF